MAFNLNAFNDEISTLAKDKTSKLKMSMTDKVNNLAKNASRDAKGRVSAVMDTITVTAKSNKRWFGHSANEFKQLHADLYSLGQILASNFFIEFEVYQGNEASVLPIFDDNLTGYLATETNIPLLQAEFESVKIGPFQANHLVGVSEPELQVNFQETADGRISNSMLLMRNLMVNPDGTINPPASYAIRIKVGLFSKDFGLDDRPIQRSLIVAPTLASIDALSGGGFSEITQVPISFTVLRNFME